MKIEATRRLDFWLFAKIYILVIIILVGLNMWWCSRYGQCWIVDVRHIHGEAFSFIKIFGLP